MAIQPADKTTKTHTLAKFVGHAGTRRVITKKDQDGLIGVPGVAKEDLIWEAGGTQKVDVTNVHEEVLEYLRGDNDFQVTTVEVPAS